MAQPPQDDVLTNGHGNDGEESKENDQDTALTPVLERNGVEPDAYAQLISSLRSQIQDLFSQVTQLNNKLVKSYDRVSDLEDNLHVARSTIRTSTLRIAQLEIERTQHLSALNTGLLVEKSHVTTELTRLMEKATEEAAQRGQAESARSAIEKDLDDLSANLFSQANTMVAEARYARALSERKVEQAELALKGAEEAVATMQQQVQSLQQQKEEADRQADDMRVIVGKGKWAAREPTPDPSAVPPLRLRSSHQPYQEFLLFVAHLRSIHLSSPSPPAVSTLLNLPFLARLLTEESEPTVRLDLAPSLNWLSRRSVLSAIHSGQVVIEPVSLNTLMTELASSHTNSTPMIPSMNSNTTNVCCALCGALVVSPADTQSSSTLPSRPSSHPLSLSRSWSGSNSNLWAASNLFKNPLSYSSASPSPNDASSKPQTLHKPSSQTIHIFRISVPSLPPTQAVSVPVSLPLFSSTPASTSHAPQPPQKGDHSRNSSQTRSPSTIYPLCTNGWCLTRLRSTCSLWAFVRTGIVDKVWEEDVSVAPTTQPVANEKEPARDTGTKPPVPPRRRGLWGMASAFGERAASWGDGDKDRAKQNGKTVPRPPTHPDVHRATTAPPPLPKRSESRRVPPLPSNLTAHPSAKRTSQVNDSDAKDTMASEKDNVQPNSQPLTISTEAATIPSTSESEPEPFLTPTEDVSEFINAKTTPEKAPAASPNHAPLSGTPPSAPVPAPSPAPSSTSSVNGLVRTASPGPPPLPRRAAARGPRPMSSWVPSASTEAAQPSAETRAVTGAAETKVVPEVQSDGPQAIRKEDMPKVPEEETPKAPEEVTPKAPEEVTPKAPESDPTPKQPSPHEAVVTVPTHINGNIGETINSSEPAPDVSSSPPTDIDSEDKTKAQLTEPGKDDVVERGSRETKNVGEGGEVYVGDATWEERSWKEVVKLREDMFWARVGGLR